MAVCLDGDRGLAQRDSVEAGQPVVLVTAWRVHDDGDRIEVVACEDNEPLDQMLELELVRVWLEIDVA